MCCYNSALMASLRRHPRRCITAQHSTLQHTTPSETTHPPLAAYAVKNTCSCPQGARIASRSPCPSKSRTISTTSQQNNGQGRSAMHMVTHTNSVRFNEHLIPQPHTVACLTFDIPVAARAVVKRVHSACARKTPQPAATTSSNSRGWSGASQKCGGPASSLLAWTHNQGWANRARWPFLSDYRAHLKQSRSGYRGPDFTPM